MEYGLARQVIGFSTFLPISEAEFLAIKNAKEGLFQCLFIEEKFDLVAENLLDFETTLIDSTVSHMLFRNQDYQSFQGRRGAFNRRLVNLLTAGRTYIDHVKHHVKNVFHGDSALAPDISALFSREYDRRLGYRAAEALRNFVQHRGLPVHSTTFNACRVDSEERESDKLRYGVTPYLRPAELREDGEFKKAVLKELEELGDKVDLKHIVREYVEGLAAVHEDIRRELKYKIQEWEALLISAIERFQTEAGNEGVAGLAAVQRNTEGQWVQQVPVFSDFIDYRTALAQKNSGLSKLSRKYVTSEVLSN